jgi:uncharacterized CHY-type Zn-finger protein
MILQDGKIRWSPRLPQWKLRQLYQTDAQGIYDIDQIDEVGMILYMRCRDILTIHKAKEERCVLCPRCESQRQQTYIPRQGGRDEIIICPVCSWSITWLDYQKSFKRMQLNPGGAVPAFSHFVDAYPKAHTAKAKMLLIDSVIHAFHYSLQAQPDLPTRPAGVNLIKGKLKDVVRLLDELSGLTPSAAMQEVHQEWRDNYRSSFWPGIYNIEGNKNAEESS